MKALVMELKSDEMIVMTGDGRFLSRPLHPEPLQIGDEINIAEPAAFRLRLTGWLAAAAIFLTVLAGSWWWQIPVTPVLGTAVSYISIDINPSVELGIDQSDQVVSWEGLNGDGKKILARLNLAGWRSADAVAALVDAAAADGYLAPALANEIIVNISRSGDGDDQAQADRLAAAAEKALAGKNLATTVSMLQTSLELRQEARELGISAAKYAIYLEAEAAGLDLDLAAVREIGIIKAIKAADGNPGQVISMARQEKAFAQKILQWKEKQAQDRQRQDSPEPAVLPEIQADDAEAAAARRAEKPNKGQAGRNEAAAEDDGQPAANDGKNRAEAKIDSGETNDQEMENKAGTAYGSVRKQRALLWLKDRIKAEIGWERKPQENQRP